MQSRNSSTSLRTRVLATALTLLALTASSCAPKLDTSACPPLKAWTTAEKRQAQQELMRLCPAAGEPSQITTKCPALALPKFIDGYATLRKGVRACYGVKTDT